MKNGLSAHQDIRVLKGFGSCCADDPGHLRRTNPLREGQLTTVLDHIVEFGVCGEAGLLQTFERGRRPYSIELEAKKLRHLRQAAKGGQLKPFYVNLDEVRHAVALYRSEERRVGKECRSRWSPD